MMKKTLCLVLVLVVIAQICAFPADKAKAVEGAEKEVEGAEKEVKGADAHAAKAAKNAENDATDEAKKIAQPEHAKRNADDHHEGAKHGAEGSHKPGAGMKHPVSQMVKGTEEVVKKVADAGTNLLTGLLGRFKL